MFNITETHIQTQYKVSSLCWDGDTLVDWVAGGHRYYLDGHVEPRHVAYRFVFDAAVVSPSGKYAAIFARGGTKGLLLQQGNILRELNRSFYHVDAYEYPITLFRLPSGQEVIAHCPDRYDQLEIEDLATGQRLTSQNARQPTDYFFSRLSATPDGAFLLSAGWVWLPVDRVQVYNVEAALADPLHLDNGGFEVDAWAEYSSAAFLPNNHLVVALAGELFDKGAYPEEDELQRQMVEQPFGLFLCFDISGAKLLWASSPQAEVGTFMPVGESHVIGFYDYPKLFDLHSGAIVNSWPHLKSGQQTNSFLRGIHPVPPAAFDIKNSRFAIANDSEITVIQLVRHHPG